MIILSAPFYFFYFLKIYVFYSVVLGYMVIVCAETMIYCRILKSIFYWRQNIEVYFLLAPFLMYDMEYPFTLSTKWY